MSTGGEQGAAQLQPDDVIRINISPETRLWAPNTAVASESALRLAQTFFPRPEEEDVGSDPFNIELFKIDPEAEETSVAIATGAAEESQEPRSLSLVFGPQADGSVLLGVSRQPLAGSGVRTVITEALAGSEAVLQAAERALDVNFATNVAAMEYLGSPSVSLPKSTISDYARRHAFIMMLDTVVRRIRSAASETPAELTEDAQQLLELIQRQAPALAEDIEDFKNNLGTQAMHPSYSASRLNTLAQLAYMQMGTEKERRRYLDQMAGMAKVMSEPRSGGAWPDIVSYHPIGDTWNKHRGGNGLQARFEWPPQPVDPRLSIAATLFVRGEYSLYQHTFTPSDESNTQLRFEIARGANSPAHGERDLAPQIEEQIRLLGGTALTAEQLEAYRQEVMQPAAGIIPGVLRSKLHVTRNSRLQISAMKPEHRFFR